MYQCIRINVRKLEKRFYTLRPHNSKVSITIIYLCTTKRRQTDPPQNRLPVFLIQVRHGPELACDDTAAGNGLDHGVGHLSTHLRGVQRLLQLGPPRQ